MSDSNDPPDGSDRSPSDLLKRWYHVPVLLGVFAFMLWTRLQSYGNFVQNGEVYFRGNDPWYHFRETMYIMENYPNRMPFDVWTGFPLGNQAGQFGTLWDHIMAVGIWIARPIMGSAEEVMLIMAPIAGALVAIPTYFIARRFVDRFAALAAVVVLALLPGTFFSYSLVGFPDHSAAEVLFQSLAILAFLVAVAVAEREAPVWGARRRPRLGRTQASRRVRGRRGRRARSLHVDVAARSPRGRIHRGLPRDQDHPVTCPTEEPEPVAFAGAVSMVVAGLMQIVPLDTFRFAVSEYSLLQIVSPLGVALGAVFLAWLARQWESRDLDAATYPPGRRRPHPASAAVVWLAIPRCGRRSPAASSTPSASRPAPALAPSVRPSRPSRTPPSPTSSSASTASRSSSRSPPFSTSSRVPLPFRRREPHALHPGRARRGRLRLRGPQLYDAIGGVVGVSWQVIGLLIAAALLVGATFLVEYDAEELYFVVWAAFIGSAAFTKFASTTTSR